MRRRSITTTKDSCLRAAAERRGYVIVKRRDKMNTPGIGRGYMVLDQFTGTILAGQKYDLSAEDVRDFLNAN